MLDFDQNIFDTLTDQQRKIDLEAQLLAILRNNFKDQFQSIVCIVDSFKKLTYERYSRVNYKTRSPHSASNESPSQFYSPVFVVCLFDDPL